MMTEVPFFDIFFEKDTHFNAVEKLPMKIQEQRFIKFS